MEKLNVETVKVPSTCTGALLICGGEEQKRGLV